MVMVRFLAVALRPARAAPLCKEPELAARTHRCCRCQWPTSRAERADCNFYSAPNTACAMNSILVLPKDELTAYAQTDDDWASVMYTNT